MILDLLAVKSIPDVAPALLVQRPELLDRRRAEGNALVSGPEEHVEAPVLVLVGVGVEGLRVGGGDGADEFGVGEQAAVEEVGRDAVGFELEGAEGEDVGGEAEGDEVGFPGGELGGGGHGLWGFEEVVAD